MSPAAQLAEGLAALGLALPAPAQQKLLAYCALLEKWNRTYSLTALREPQKAVSHHLLDSLSILPWVPQGSLLDVGSGGGMPGIPLAIAQPALAVTLLDSNSKKAAFLQQAAIELELANISVHCGRVEQYHPSIGCEAYTSITSRAFSELADFIAGSAHLLAEGGIWLAMKGQYPEEEIAKLPHGVCVKAVHRLQVAGIEGERHLALITRAPQR